MDAAAEARPLNVGNYCVLFLDLLGQKRLMEGHGFLPRTQAEVEEVFRTTLRSVTKLHEYIDRFLGNEVQAGPITVQRWSDGVMVFVPIGGPTGNRACEAIFSVLSYASAMLLFGLAAQAPMRAGLDISWGVELQPRELYGPAVANAYRLESVVAQYPRVAVGGRVEEYLSERVQNASDDLPGRIERAFAERCLAKLFVDEDGNRALDFLRDLPDMPANADGNNLITLARQFVEVQIAEHAAANDEKLLGRYRWLERYISAR